MLKILLLGAISVGMPAVDNSVSPSLHMYEGGQAKVQLAQDYDSSGISAADAADIASQAYPGYRVIKVKYLNSGVYAVTLKANGNVERVMVRASDGAIL
jgi:uncharacterized membrane protein YkoI